MVGEVQVASHLLFRLNMLSSLYSERCRAREGHLIVQRQTYFCVCGTTVRAVSGAAQVHGACWADEAATATWSSTPNVYRVYTHAPRAPCAGHGPARELCGRHTHRGDTAKSGHGPFPASLRTPRRPTTRPLRRHGRRGAVPSPYRLAPRPRSAGCEHECARRIGRPHTFPQQSMRRERVARVPTPHCFHRVLRLLPFRDGVAPARAHGVSGRIGPGPPAAPPNPPRRRSAVALQHGWADRRAASLASPVRWPRPRDGALPEPRRRFAGPPRGSTHGRPRPAAPSSLRPPDAGGRLAW